MKIEDIENRKDLFSRFENRIRKKTLKEVSKLAYKKNLYWRIKGENALKLSKELSRDFINKADALFSIHREIERMIER